MLEKVLWPKKISKRKNEMAGRRGLFQPFRIANHIWAGTCILGDTVSSPRDDADSVSTGRWGRELGVPST